MIERREGTEVKMVDAGDRSNHKFLKSIKGKKSEVGWGGRQEAGTEALDAMTKRHEFYLTAWVSANFSVTDLGNYSTAIVT